MKSGNQGYATIICTWALLSASVCSGADVAATAPVDPFAPLRAWFYNGEPLPEAGSEAARRMREHYGENFKDPAVMYWAAVAQSRGLVNTSRSPKDLTEESARRGHQGAMARLGAAHLTGETVPHDVGKGLELLNRALAAGEPHAALELGRAYMSGLGGVEVDLDRAEAFFRQALKMGYVRAHRGLSQVLAKRGHVGEALIELRAGALAGDEDAMTAYAVALQKGELGAQRDPKQAVEWMQKAAKRGVASAQRDVAKAIIMRYAGIPANQQNDDFGREMLHKAAAAKDPEAMRILARIYQTTELGAQFSPEKALELLQAAAGMNDAAACHDLAIMYVEGFVAPRDLERARDLMRRAESLGFEPARVYLLRLNRTLPTTREALMPSDG